MKQPADIICFGKDWNEPKTSVNHVMEELAKRHRVLWVNSLSMRSPNLASGNDIKKIFRKVASWFKGITIVHENLRVLTPIALPLPQSPIAQRINKFLVRWLIKRNARRWGFKNPQVWIFPPNAVEFVGLFHESLVIYYCVDDFSKMSYLNADFMVKKEAELISKADAIFVSAGKLLQTKAAGHPHFHTSPHGVDHALFARALDSDYPVGEELKSLPRPIIGFYGNLYDWVDQDLLAAMAKSRPQWSFVLIGKLMTDVTTLRAQANIRLLGPRPHEQLPQYCKGFDVGIIPYKVTDPRMPTVNPLKLREYMAAGLPVVTIDLEEARPLSSLIQVAQTPEEFIQAIERALKTNSPEQKRARSDAMRGETWAARVANIERHLEAAQAGKL